MPLSEEELRLLEQMERALAAEDPKFVSALQGRTLRRTARLRTIGAGIVFACGVALMMGGAVAGLTWLGAIGFVIMLASATLGLASWRGQHVPEERPAGPEALFDFDDHPHRFDVIDGGRAAKQRRPSAPRAPKPARRPRTPKQGTFLQRMEQRWHRRRDQGGY